jgi:type II secretory pathway component GspD/PulD (secretin)
MVLSVLFVPGAAYAQEANPGAARTSIDCRDVSARVALRTLLQNAGVRFVVQGEIPVARVTLKLSNVPVEDALKVLVRQLDFTVPHHLRVQEAQGVYRIEDDSSRITNGIDGALRLQEAEPTVSMLAKRRVDIEGLSLRAAFDRLFTLAGASVVVDADVPDVLVTTPVPRPVTLWTTITQLVANARTEGTELYIGQVGEVYVVARRGRLIPPRVAALGGDGEVVRRISLKLEQVPLRAAIEAIFAGTGYQYSVDPEVPNVPVTIEMRDVEVQVALRLLLRSVRRQVPGLTFSKG